MMGSMNKWDITHTCVVAIGVYSGQFERREESEKEEETNSCEVR
jgi:hypothetical protein